MHNIRNNSVEIPFKTDSIVASSRTNTKIREPIYTLVIFAQTNKVWSTAPSIRCQINPMQISNKTELIRVIKWDRYTSGNQKTKITMIVVKRNPFKKIARLSSFISKVHWLSVLTDICKWQFFLTINCVNISVSTFFFIFRNPNISKSFRMKTKRIESVWKWNIDRISSQIRFYNRTIFDSFSRIEHLIEIGEHRILTIERWYGFFATFWRLFLK